VHLYFYGATFREFQPSPVGYNRFRYGTVPAQVPPDRLRHHRRL